MAIDEADLPVCSPGQLPATFTHAAGQIQRAFLELLGSALTETLQTPVSSTHLPPEQGTFGSFLDGDEAAACLVALDLAPLTGYAVLGFSKEILFKALEILTAAPSNTEYNPRETVTGIELHILREFFDAFRNALRKAWQPFYPLEFEIRAIDRDMTRQAALAQYGQAAVILKSRIQCGGADAGFELALPGFLLRLADARKQVPSWTGNEGQVQQSLPAALGRAKVLVEAVLEGSGVRMSELLALRPGQILSMGTPANGLFECMLNGKPKFKGEVTAAGGHLAFRIETQDVV